jgi:excisionase family DNA binding protein
VTQNKTSLQQLRQTLDDLRQALEAVESALIEFEDQEALGEEGSEEEGAHSFQSSGKGFELLAIPEVCQELGMGKSWVYRKLKSAEIPSIKLGHNIKVKREDLEEYLESQRYQPSSEEQ